MNRSLLPKTIQVCSIHSMEDPFGESQELKRFFLGDKLKYLSKLHGFASLPSHWKVNNKSGYPI